MKWLLEHFQIVILVGLAVASWLKRRMDARTAEAEAPQQSEDLPDDEEVFGPGEVWQIPPRPPSEPPPLARAVRPPVEPVVLYQSAAMLKRRQILPQPVPATPHAKTTTTGGAVATRTRVSAAQRHPKTAVSAVPGSLRESLRHPKDLRRAIVLREILGPPVGLR